MRRGARARRERITRYQLQICEAEFTALRTELESKQAVVAKIAFDPAVALADMPDLRDIYTWLRRSWPSVLFARIQESVWTTRRLRTRIWRDAPKPGGLGTDASADPGPSVAPASPYPKLYIDITATHRGTVAGGIERVCRRIAAEFDGSPIAQPVVTLDGVSREITKDGTAGRAVTISAQDTYLVLDSFWEPPEDHANKLAQAHQAGARTALCVHDVIPLLHPGLLGEGAAKIFVERLAATLPLVDVVVAVSASSAREIRRVLRLAGQRKTVLWFHLGADPLARPSRTSHAAQASSPQFVSVGTLEPKKGYDCALDAFDQIWKDGLDARYLIVGRVGWFCGALVRRIQSHPEYGKRLIWLDNASDEEMQAALGESYCYLQASLAEGFGLPIIEAAQAGLPIIASDLPVFREIAGPAIQYFPVCDRDALAISIRNAVAHRPPAAKIDASTWGQSAAALLRALNIRGRADKGLAPINKRQRGDRLTRAGDRNNSRSRDDRLLRYQLRVFETETERLSADLDRLRVIFGRIGIPFEATVEDVPDLPDVWPFLQRPFARFLLTRAQEAIWTWRRLRGDKQIFPEIEAAASNPSAAVKTPSLDTSRDAEARPPSPIGRLYLSVTAAHRGQVDGGIKRVCQRLSDEMRLSGDGQAVVLDQGQLHILEADASVGPAITLTPRDTMLVLDSFWNDGEATLESLRLAREIGARTALCVYDVIPILYPGLIGLAWACFFEDRLRAILPAVDLVVSVSQASARDIRRIVRTHGHTQRVVWFHLGSDVSSQPSRRVTPPAHKPVSRFVSVGTLEPKKGYDCALDAFDALWARDVDVRYTIIGRPGWLCSALVKRIRGHREYGARLSWLDGPNDAEMQAALASSHCYVQASVAEGFGLPIIEAAQVGLPIIASDLAVFREICGAGTPYFPVCDPNGLANLVAASLEHPPVPSQIELMTWAQSAQMLLDALDHRERHP